MTTAAGAQGLSPARAVLDNGVTVVAKESRATPAVTLHASIRAGTVFDPVDLGGLAHFLARTIDRGTSTRTADDLADELDTKGVSLNVSVNRHAVSIVCTCLVEDFEPVLALLADVIRNPSFPEAEVETRRREIVTLIRQDDDNPAAVSMERLMALLYGAGHPYGREARGTVESVERIDRAALLACHASHVLPPHLSLVMVGDFDRSRALAAAADFFGDWRVAGAAAVHGASLSDPPPLDAPTPAAARRVQVVPMMNKAQADIAYGFTSITRSDPEYHACSLMNVILGQYSLGGRLGDSIRERQGMAYYVFSSLDANVIPGPMLIRAGVNPSNVERSLASIDQELTRFAADGPTEDEVVETKQYVIGSMPRTLETNAGIASYLQTVEFFALGLDYDLRVPSLVRAVTRDDVHAAAQRLLDAGRATVVVAGPYDGSPR
jgi:zinc protease